MYIGQTIRCKYEDKIIECIVIALFEEDVMLEYEGKNLTRKYWEIRPMEIKNEKEKTD
jgi:hypothetical protein